MIVFADTSFLYSSYFPDQSRHADAARRFWKQGVSISVSPAVVLELRLGAIYDAKNETGWELFLRDKQAKKINEISVEWEKLFYRFEPIALQHPSKRVGLADGLHVLAALQSGATHFLSFDFRSGQRAIARAVGLTVLPERMAGEFN